MAPRINKTTAHPWCRFGVKSILVNCSGRDDICVVVVWDSLRSLLPVRPLFSLPYHFRLIRNGY